MKCRILIAEDDYAIGKLLQFTLTRANFEVIITSNEQEFRSRLKEPLPDLILLDVFLMNKNGVELYETLLSEGLDPQLPILFLSAMVSRTSSIPGPSGKQYTVLPKPFESEELVSFLRTAIENASRTNPNQLPKAC